MPGSTTFLHRCKTLRRKTKLPDRKVRELCDLSASGPYFTGPDRSRRPRRVGRRRRRRGTRSAACNCNRAANVYRTNQTASRNLEDASAKVLQGGPEAARSDRLELFNGKLAIRKVVVRRSVTCLSCVDGARSFPQRWARCRVHKLVCHDQCHLLATCRAFVASVPMCDHNSSSVDLFGETKSSAKKQSSRTLRSASCVADQPALWLQ